MNFKVSLFLALAVSTIGIAVGGPFADGKMVPEPAGEQGGEPRWRLSAGYSYRRLGEATFRTGSYSQGHVLDSLTGRAFRRGTGAGVASGLADRFYRDGFVRIDSSGSFDGLTTFWAYRSSAQVVGDAIVQTSRPARRRQVERSRQFSPSSWSDDFAAGGPLFELEYQVPVGEAFKVGVEVAASWVQWDGANSGSSFRARQSSITSETVVTDRFGLGGGIPPSAPFEGSFAGPGFLLDAVPSARSVSQREVGRQRFDFFNRIDESLNVDLYTLSPGLSAQWDGEKVFANAGFGLAINIADWQARYREVLYVSKDGGRAKAVQSWSRASGGTDVLLGVYLQTGLGLHVTERFSVQGFARYDWSQSLRGSVGPSSFELGLDGVSGGVMASWTF